MKLAPLALLAIAILPTWCPGECIPFTDQTRSAVLRNLAYRWNLGDASLLTLTPGEFVAGTCYQRLTLEGNQLKRKWTLFISPDHRFVFGSLVDVTVDFAEERRQQADEVENRLLADKSPQKGSPTAPITIVEFADFQCPYCKQFDSMLKSLPSEAKDKIKVVFKALPLPNHSWAREGAQAAMCAGLQSDAAFWAVHDQLFGHQELLVVSHFNEEITNLTTGLATVDQQALLSCVINGGATQLIERDMRLAESMSVRSTPTIFVNGEPAPRFGSFHELRQWLLGVVDRVSQHDPVGDKTAFRKRKE